MWLEKRGVARNPSTCLYGRLVGWASSGVGNLRPPARHQNQPLLPIKRGRGRWKLALKNSKTRGACWSRRFDKRICLLQGCNLVTCVVKINMTSIPVLQALLVCEDHSNCNLEKKPRPSNVFGCLNCVCHFTKSSCSNEISDFPMGIMEGIPMLDMCHASSDTTKWIRLTIRPRKT